MSEREKVPTGSDALLHSSGEETMNPPGARHGSGQAASYEEDLRLMALVAAGNTQAMNTVAHRLSGRVRRLCRAIVRDGALAEDASQLALVEILESARTYGGRSSLERWADRITARVTLRHAREERRRFQVLSSIDDAEAVEPSAPAHDFADGARGATPRDLEEYLGALSEVQREALLMKHSLGYTVEEIAELLTVPVGTVKDRLVAARRQVRKLIQRDLTLRGRKSGT